MPIPEQFRRKRRRQSIPKTKQPDILACYGHTKPIPLTGCGAGVMSGQRMATPTTLSALLEQKRRILIQLQEDIAALERAQALLSGRQTPSAKPAPARSARPAHPPLRTLLLDLLKASPTPLSPSAIRARLAARGHRFSRSTLMHLLPDLVKQGAIRRTGPGLYAWSNGLSRATRTTAMSSAVSPAASGTTPTPQPRRARKPAARVRR